MSLSLRADQKAIIDASLSSATGENANATPRSTSNVAGTCTSSPLDEGTVNAYDEDYDYDSERDALRPQSRGDYEQLEHENDYESNNNTQRALRRQRVSSMTIPKITPEMRIMSERRRYIYASTALTIALAAFVVQTEAAGYLSSAKKFKKPLFMLYLTHSSWILLWPCEIVVVRLFKRHTTFKQYFKKHWHNVHKTASIVADENVKSRFRNRPITYIAAATAKLTLCLSIAGSTWYIAVNWTTPSDLTAIYNCSAFFAYIFSVPLLGDKFRIDKTISVVLAIIGVLLVAYGGNTAPRDDDDDDDDSSKRLAGNIVIAVGAVLYGLYEVLYKAIACPPITVSPRRQSVFALVIGSCIGCWTLLVVWIVLPIAHLSGFETFQWPDKGTWGIILLSVTGNVVFSASFLILMSLTSPVLSGVAALTTIFLVAIVDWIIFGTPIGIIAVVGGIVICIAFGILTWASWVEITGTGEDEADISGDEG